MKKIISQSVLLFCFFCCIGCAEKTKPQLTEAIKSGLRQDAKEFMDSIKVILVKEMQANGIVAAISVCSDTAQLLTVNYGFSKGIYIKRVSLKNRNPLNAPDGFESKVLHYFRQLGFDSKLDSASEFFEIINSEGVSSVRYMKPIIIQAPCLGCHGAVENIGPDVKEILNNRYPDDKATGYQIDDLRGAVSIQKTL
ncbi:MAG: DUF3365 domain-containing protein [Ignavibacteria bacterium]|nr:DUF3365 domain-containing protein [Ignavibacteria bacterium]